MILPMKCYIDPPLPILKYINCLGPEIELINEVKVVKITNVL